MVIFFWSQNTMRVHRLLKISTCILAHAWVCVCVCVKNLTSFLSSAISCLSWVIYCLESEWFSWPWISPSSFCRQYTHTHIYTWLYSVYTNIYKENRPICDAHAHLVVNRYLSIARELYLQSNGQCNSDVCIKGIVHFWKKKLLLIIYSPPCHPRCPCRKEIKVFDKHSSIVSI